ncbi:MAG: nicotinate-nucleotide--dimethylbenzimidazole phosphoribosyltransferase [Deltaproteobacteria bacterium]|nr:nicotinate-nucleotide--dimethylbenzimidazole phosphoribosyltransferase [Deltaproteobacteria bacterium]
MKIIKETATAIKELDKSYFEKAQERLDSLTKPRGSLGRLEELAAQVVTIREDLAPKLDNKVIFTFAGDHGVTEEGVSAFPKEVTPQMVFNFLNGGAGINVLARQAGAEVAVVDIGVDYDFEEAEGLIQKKVVKGTKNMAKGPAMTREEAEKCIEVGINLANDFADKGYNLFGTGEMGIGNTTPSSAIITVFSGKSAREVTGRGTGIDDEALENKAKVIEKAIELNKPDANDAIDVLTKVGGAEIAGIAGLCLGAAARGIPVLIDGFISTAGALIAYEIEPKVKEYMISAHKSVEKGHEIMLERMGLRPIIDLDFRLGEGTGAAIGMAIVESAVRIYNEMATFAEASVSEEE